MNDKNEELHLKVKEIENMITITKTEGQQMQEKITHEVMALERDIDDMRRHSKEKEFDDKPSAGPQFQSNDVNQKIELLVDETNQLWNFVQNYVDEQTFTPVKIIKSSRLDLEDKMNSMEWVSRTSPFLSPDAIAKCINAFKELYNTPNSEKRTEYVKGTHNSNAVFTVIDSIQDLLTGRKPDDSAETDARIAIHLSVLEPLIINDHNLEKALDADVIGTVLDCIDITDMKANNPKDPPIYLKYAMRCFTSSLRKPRSLEKLFQVSNAIEKVLDIVEFIQDQEIVANSTKVLRIVMKEDQYLDIISKKNKEVGNVICKAMESHAYSVAVSQEAAVALKFFTSKQEYVALLQKECMGGLINVFHEVKNDKVKANIVAILNQCAEVRQYSKYISEVGGDTFLKK